MSTTGSSGSYSTRIRPAARRACSGCSLAEVAHLVEREHRLVAELEAVPLLPRDVVVREHRVHAGHRQCVCEVDPEQTRVGVRAAQRVTPEHVGGEEVAGVRELAGHLRERVGAADGLADAAELELPRRTAHSSDRTAASISS
jgi:hypothetical protein